MTFYKLPDSLEGDIRDFKENIGLYQNGELNPVAFKGIRVGMGVYEQRKPKTHMVRVRCPAGGVTPEQLKQVGLLAGQFGSGEIHVTTRQEMQLHYVKLDDIITVQEELGKIGLSSRGGGGNTVRNIMAAHDSGISADEIFDVMPYAVALTTRMIAESDSWNLPRKFKIAFSNRKQDTIRASLTCLGFFADIRDGEKGFRVYCAGGMGAKPITGRLLLDFIPVDHVYHVTRAMKTMFDKHGNRRRRNLARLKFLWEKLGEEQFRVIFREEYNCLKDQDDLALVLPELENRANVTAGYQAQIPSNSGFELWKRRYATEQKQSGLFQIEVPLKLGDINASDAVRIGEVMSAFGNNCLRFTVFQNIHFRNIPKAYLGNIYNLLDSIDSLSADPAMFGSMVACTGADTCKLGICLPRGVTPVIQETLLGSGMDLDLLAEVKIHISGCPNTCGCHHAADLGFFGKVKRKGKDMLPGYNILVGAILEEGRARFSRMVGDIAAKHVPFFVRDLLTKYLEHKAEYQNFTAYVDGPGEADIRALSEAYHVLPDRIEDPEFYRDWGTDDDFTLLKGQKAECSAGMFDLIDVDAKIIRQRLAQADTASDGAARALELGSAVFAACRMLLVTRGIEAKSEEQVYDHFLQHFIRTDLISDRFSQLIADGKAKNRGALLKRESEIRELADEVSKLYKSMDDSLRFKAAPAPSMDRQTFLSSLSV